MAESVKNEKPIFRDLAADDPEPEATEIESLCTNCEKNGVTRLLLTKIPFYKEVILMSFECEHCGFRNNEIQPGGSIDDKGVRICLNVKNKDDLNRQVVKSDYASIKILEVDLEIPSQSQKGDITTIEGILQRSIDALLQEQPIRKVETPEAAEEIEKFIEKMLALKAGDNFTFILEDISGNSYVENPNAPASDPAMSIHHFLRSKEQDHTLGIFQREEITNDDGDGILKKADAFTYEDLLGEVLHFPTNCPNCSSPCSTNMKMTSIPYFKEVVIMATNCDRCGNRTNEVKSGGGIEPKGLRMEVKVGGMEDFSRDVLKSETCHIFIPELDLEVGPTTLGGRFTTIEGLVMAIKDQLKKNGFMGDSMIPGARRRYLEFLEKMDKLLEGRKPFTIILDDPAGNSYIQNLFHPEPDPKLKITHYERTYEMNEELGINDMKTENYGENETDDQSNDGHSKSNASGS
ncbi:zinc finger protein ZPR1 [Ischnura elegans]|uniref:zinc finger protein ZPR1 n=1 Tax=Ischnura elegans TaxID=197161 RepID=UPI001ED86AFE|nr:zinc finger protein ZPR1 [Ischnura elegans]